MKRPTPFGKYLLLERLNVGGMAEVFMAKAFGVEGFERILAIKKILPTMAEDQEFITMFIDEARICVHLNHANIVHIDELGRHDGAYYIAMEYVPGRDLRTLLEQFRRRKEIMPTAMAVYCATKMCEALDYAHRKKDAQGNDLSIIHRDVSPQNILISYEGEVKIIDFGIAKAANRSQKTQAGILKGKFGYMSPEQVRGLPIDRRSDIFAVGVIMFEMLTGERLFTGESDFSTLEKVRNAVVPSLRQFNSAVPVGLEKVVQRALARESDDRYQWASDLHEDLMRFLLAGDAIYSGKHLAAFMKERFADELVRESERMKRFAEIERPDDVQPSGVLAIPRKSIEMLARSTETATGNGNGRRLGGPDASQTESVAEDHTVLMSRALVSADSAVSAPADEPSNSALGDDDEGLGATHSSRPKVGFDTGNDLQPLEMTGFRPAVAPRDATFPPRRPKPKIVIGDAPTGGSTQVAESPLRNDSEDEVEPYDDEEEPPGEEDSEQHEVDQPEAALSKEETRRPSVRPNAVSPSATPSDPRRRVLLIAIAVTSSVALMVLVATVIKYVQNSRSSGKKPQPTKVATGVTVAQPPRNIDSFDAAVADTVAAHQERPSGVDAGVETQHSLAVPTREPGAVAAAPDAGTLSGPVAEKNERLGERSVRVPKTVSSRSPSEKVSPKEKEPVAKSTAPKGKGKLGRVAFASKPMGAEIWVDGKNTGKRTPVPQAQALELPVGRHRVVFKNEGASSMPVDVEVGEEHAEKPLVVKGEI